MFDDFDYDHKLDRRYGLQSRSHSDCVGRTCQFWPRLVQAFTVRFKVAVIKILRLRMDHITTWNMSLVVTNPTENNPSILQISVWVFQLIVLVFWSATLLFWFNHTLLKCHFQPHQAPGFCKKKKLAAKKLDISLRNSEEWIFNFHPPYQCWTHSLCPLPVSSQNISYCRFDAFCSLSSFIRSNTLFSQGWL